MTDLQHAKTLPFVGRRDAEPATQVYGEITSVEGGEYAVRTSGGIQVARRAVSCLVAPEIADRVLMAIGPGGESFVLAVLERDHDQVNIAPDGDLRIELAEGSFAVVAKEGVELVSAKGLGLTADEMRLHARQGGVFFDALSYAGRLVHADVERVQAVAGAIDQVVSRVSQRLKNAYRFVEGLDQQRSGQLDIRAEKSAKLRAENTIVTAEELVKVDGDQIHLG